MTSNQNNKLNYSLNRHFYNIIKTIILLWSIVASVYVYYTTDHDGYENLYLQPLVFSIIFILLLSPLLFKNNNIFISIFSIVAFIRYTILPVLIVYTNYYGGRSLVPPNAASYSNAINLMIYELVVISIIIYIVFKKSSNKNNNITEYFVPKNNFIYILFILFSISMLIISPNSIRYFSFLAPTENTLNLGEGSNLNSITFYLLLTSKYLVFLLIMSGLYKKYLKTKGKIYVLFSLIVVLVNISIIFGSNRADFIIPAIASLLLFYKMYPRYGKIVSVFIGVLIISITLLISNERSLASYTDGSNVLVDTTDLLQIYLGGPYNVAIASEITVSNPQQRNLGYFAYDMLRPTIGMNLLLKQYDVPMSSYIFNERIFFTDQRSHNIPIIGQGYLYFGFILSPIIYIFFIILIKFFLNIIEKERRIELVFFLTIPVARVGLGMGQNGTILMNDISFFLVMSLIIYYLNNKFDIRKT